MLGSTLIKVSEITSNEHIEREIAFVKISGKDIDEKTINYDLLALEQYNINYSANTAEAGNGNAGDWSASNMSVIAYIYNTNTKEIVQVEEAHLNN